MKRFRVLNIDFDMRANILNFEISPSWEPHIQQHHREAQAQLWQNLFLQYGLYLDRRAVLARSHAIARQPRRTRERETI
jgi:hypothetical protein